MFLRLLLALALVLAAGCTTTSLDPIESSEFVVESDEQLTWDAAAEIDRLIADSGLVVEDAALSAYLNTVAARLAPHLGETVLSPRVRVVLDPYQNAFSLPTGSIYIHSGLLVRLNSEAELATLLGHEMTHYVRRHTVARDRAVNRRRTAKVFLLVLLAVPSGGASLVGLIPRATTRRIEQISAAQRSGYSLELEREADSLGIQAMRLAGYDPREAPRLFEHLKDSEGDQLPLMDPYYYAQHPKLEERTESYRKYLAAMSPLSDKEFRPESGTLARLAAEVALQNAELDLDLRRLGSAERAVGKFIAVAPDDSRGSLLRGRILERSSMDVGSTEAALLAFEQAVKLDPSSAEGHKRLGLLARRAGNDARACEALQVYLELDPDAVDRGIVEAYLTEIGAADGQ
jgi:predicted Zn-dependent protease